MIFAHSRQPMRMHSSSRFSFDTRSLFANAVRFVSLFAAAFALTSETLAQEQPKPITYAETRMLQSAILGETRTLQIALPQSYAQTRMQYPVLFLLDGSSQILYATGTVRYLSAARNRIPEMILVSIPNTNRNRDLTPGAGATMFQRFLAEELIPWVERNFRAAPDRILFGHSLGGSFVVHTLLNRPELFQGYIAVSAPVWRYDGLAAQLKPGLTRAVAAGAELFLSVGENENAQLMQGVRSFAALSDSMRPKLSMTYTELVDEDHSSTASRSLYNALEARYKTWRFPFFETMAELDSAGGMAALARNYANESKHFHYSIPVPPARVVQAGRIFIENARHDEAIKLAEEYRDVSPSLAEELINLSAKDLLRLKQIDRAILALRKNVGFFPESPSAHEALGDALCQTKSEASANESFATAFRLRSQRAATSASSTTSAKKVCST